MDDPYAVLNLYPDCTFAEAKAAYRQAALLHHPDRQPPARKEEAARRFRILAQAFQQICIHLGCPIDQPENPRGPKPANSTRTTGTTTLAKSPAAPTSNKNPPSIASPPTSRAPALTRGPSTKAITQPPKAPKALPAAADDRSGRSDTSGSSEGPLQARPPAAKTRTRPAAEPEPELELEEEEPYSSGESEQEQPAYHARQPSRLPPPSPERHHDHPRSHYPRHSASRRSSFSHPAPEPPHTRAPVADYYHHPLGPKHYARPQPDDYPAGPRQQLYDLPGGGGRDRQQWDFGLGEDEFFGSGPDRFGAAGAMMGELGSGFDRMMSSAFKGLSMAGPDPAALAQAGAGEGCAMRIRQSKMVMGRTQDGSWAGKRMEKQMNMADGKLEVNENAQDIRMGGRQGGSTRQPAREGHMRRGAEDWDPPPAYHGGAGEAPYGRAEYEPDMEHYQAGYHHPQQQQPHHGGPRALHGAEGGYGGGPGELVPGRRRSVSRARAPVGFPDDDARLQRRAGYAPDLGHHARPHPHIAHPGFAPGPHPMGRSLARRPSGDVSARY